MLMLKSKEMREQRAKLIADSRALLNGELNEETRKQIKKMDEDIDKMSADIEIYEKQEQRERELVMAEREAIVPGDHDEEARKKLAAAETRKYNEAFEAYLRGGSENLTAEQRSILRPGAVKDSASEKRAQTLAGAGGGYTIAQGFMPELEKAQLAFGGVRQAARVLTTNSGNIIPWPTVDDTGNTGEDSVINVAANGQDVVFGSVNLNAYKMDSGIILVPNELLEDTSLPLETEIGALIGERLGRRQNAKQTTGSGVGTFQGIAVAAPVAMTSAAPTAIAPDELIDFQHKVDPAYRENPKCAFMMNDDTMRIIRKLKDNNGRYLLEYSELPGEFAAMLGKKVIANQQMATVAANAVSILFGDFSKFILRDVRGIVVRRLNELYATADQTAFIAWYRGDSRLVSASQKALVAFQQHA